MNQIDPQFEARTDQEWLNKAELQSLETICEIGSAAVDALEEILGEDEGDASVYKAEDVEAGVKFIVDNPAAPLAAQHQAWIERNRARLKPDDPRLVPYEQLPFGMQLKARLWRHIVHAIIG